MSETFLPTIASASGGFFGGIMLGYFLKKIIKILIFVAGGIVALLLYLQQQQLISVDVEKMENSLTYIVSSFASSFGNITPINDTNLGIPIVGALSAGIAIGFMKG